MSILFVGSKKIKQLNTAFRGIHKATDVLSFPQLRAGERKSRRAETTPEFQNFRTSELILLGDIVICIPTAVARAEISGVDFYDEIYRLLIHGVLHLLGYSHEKLRYRAAAMRKKEQEIFNAIKKMG